MCPDCQRGDGRLRLESVEPILRKQLFRGRRWCSLLDHRGPGSASDRRDAQGHGPGSPGPTSPVDGGVVNDPAVLLEVTSPQSVYNVPWVFEVLFEVYELSNPTTAVYSGLVVQGEGRTSHALPGNGGRTSPQSVYNVPWVFEVLFEVYELSNPTTAVYSGLVVQGEGRTSHALPGNVLLDETVYVWRARAESEGEGGPVRGPRSPASRHNSSRSIRRPHQVP